MSEVKRCPEWAAICIYLLQGPVYREGLNDKNWNILERNISEISKYFAVIGIKVVIDNEDGFAFLSQYDSEDDYDENNEYTKLPRLIRKSALSPEVALLCVVLREALDSFEASGDVSSACVLKESQIKDMLQVFIPEHSDQTKVYRQFDEYLSKLESLTFIKEINKRDDGREQNIDREFEIRKILKAKIDANFMEEFKRKLKELSNEQ
ncbi:MAG: DUF4194 domain-containing protein [Treponema sp.]|nr:DUF4194 domain-containing protein [Treponema sp.]